MAILGGYNLLIHSGENIWRPLLQTFFAQGSANFLDHNVPLWFVPCLFVIEMMYYYIDKLQIKYNVLLCVLCGCIGIWMIEGTCSNFFKLLPWSIESALVSVIFYCVGNILTKHYPLNEIEMKVVSKKKLAVCMISILTIVLVFTAHWNGHISLGSDLLGKNPAVFYFNAFIGIISIFLFAMLLCSIRIKNKFFAKIKDFHLWFGRNSFYIMATHFPLKEVFIRSTCYFLGCGREYVINSIPLCIIIFTLTIIVDSIVVVVICRWKEKDMQRFEKYKMRKQGYAR